jgi:glycerol-3-phosphate O-acyltransferase
MSPNQDLESNLEVNQRTGSHPAIKFEQIPIISGPLSNLDRIRPDLLKAVALKTQADLSRYNPESLLGEALYSERFRLKRSRPNIFTKTRFKNDQRLWSQIQHGLVKPSAEVARPDLVRQVIQHYAEEIGGHFDPRIYWLATRAVPWGFNWLLNAASVKRFLPWGMTESLQSRLHILGEVPLLQKLVNQGTILLVPTHQSNIDSVLIGYVIYLMSMPPFAYGAGLNLFSNPALSFFLSELGSYTVDRQKSNLIYKHTLKNYSTRILRDGVHSIFFPGGGRARSGAIESHVKLGLLGTGLDAQIEALQAGQAKNRIYVVPLVMSYDFVLEAASLIEDYLAESGKHRFIITDDESWQPSKIVGFFWKLFSSRSAITVRIGRPLDIFGNLVNDDGQSIGPNGTTIDPARWLTTRGELRSEEQRDQEYTRQLGERLSERYHRENTVLSSHLVAFAFFETLRSKYPEFDLFKLLRLTLEQRSLQLSEFMASAEVYYAKLRAAADRGELFLSDDLRSSSDGKWVRAGARQLGLLHDAAVVKIQDNAVWTEDMSLLYYYRNRLSGYGFSRLAKVGGQLNQMGQNDSQGFLA